MDTAAEMPNPRGRVLGTGVSLNVKLTCKNWYSNSRTCPMITRMNYG